jgi:1,4-dihydroxy-2-naphthoyl-CoA synthase
MPRQLMTELCLSGDRITAERNPEAVEGIAAFFEKRTPNFVALRRQPV